MNGTEVKTFAYDPQIYPIELHVAITHDLKRVLQKYAEPDGSEIGDGWGKYTSAYTFYGIKERATRRAVVLVVFRGKKSADPPTVAHEAKHVADRIFEHIGEENTVHESHAYLVEWAVKCINSSLKRNNRVNFAEPS
jgi:hypothetical protein